MCGYAALSFYRAGRTLSGVSLTGKAQSSAVSSFLAKTGHDKNITEKLTIVMATPQADFCAVFWNDLNATYEKVYKIYGESLSKFIEIQIYCTSKDATKSDELLRTTSATALGDSGALRLHRPDFEALTQAPLMNQVTRDYWEGRPKFTSSLVYFCGSPKIGSKSLTRSSTPRWPLKYSPALTTSSISWKKTTAKRGRKNRTTCLHLER